MPAVRCPTSHPSAYLCPAAHQLPSWSMAPHSAGTMQQWQLCYSSIRGQILPAVGSSLVLPARADLYVILRIASDPPEAKYLWRTTAHPTCPTSSSSLHSGHLYTHTIATSLIHNITPRTDLTVHLHSTHQSQTPSSPWASRLSKTGRRPKRCTTGACTCLPLPPQWAPWHSATTARSLVPPMRARAFRVILESQPCRTRPRMIPAPI